MRDRQAIVALLASLLPVLAACGASGDAEATTESAASPTASGDDSASPSTDTKGAAVVVIEGVTYTFAVRSAVTGRCQESFGALIAQMPLTEVDGSPPQEGAGQFGMTLGHPEGEDSITVDLPDGLFIAGDNDIELESPDIDLTRDGSSARGTQPLTSPAGEGIVADIDVSCP